jgi:hypothetical protein
MSSCTPSHEKFAKEGQQRGGPFVKTLIAIGAEVQTVLRDFRRAFDAYRKAPASRGRRAAQLA